MGVIHKSALFFVTYWRQKMLPKPQSKSIPFYLVPSDYLMKVIQVLRGPEVLKESMSDFVSIPKLAKVWYPCTFHPRCLTQLGQLTHKLSLCVQKEIYASSNTQRNAGESCLRCILKLV